VWLKLHKHVRVVAAVLVLIWGMQPVKDVPQFQQLVLQMPIIDGSGLLTQVALLAKGKGIMQLATEHMRAEKNKPAAAHRVIRSLCCPKLL